LRYGTWKKVMTTGEQEQGERIILLLDDDPNFFRLLRLVLPEHYSLLWCTRGEDALTLLSARPVDLVLVDLLLDGVRPTSSRAFVSAISAQYPFLKVVLLSAHLHDSVVEDFLEMPNVVDAWDKNVQETLLVRRLANLCASGQPRYSASDPIALLELFERQRHLCARLDRFLTVGVIGIVEHLAAERDISRSEALRYLGLARSTYYRMLHEQKGAWDCDTTLPAE